MAAGCWSVIKRFCSGLSSHFTDSESESGECELKSHNRLRSICNTKLLQRTIRSKSPDRDSSRVQQELLGTGDWYSRPIDTQLEDALTHPPPDVKKTIMSNSLVKILCRATSEKHSDGQHAAQPRDREEPISLTLLCLSSSYGGACRCVQNLLSLRVCPVCYFQFWAFQDDFCSNYTVVVVVFLCVFITGLNTLKSNFSF